MIKFNTWYMARSPYNLSKNDIFYNYFYKPNNFKINYYSIALNHPDVGYDFAFVENESYNHCKDNIIDKFLFFEVDEKFILKDCFK